MGDGYRSSLNGARNVGQTSQLQVPDRVISASLSRIYIQIIVVRSDEECYPEKRPRICTRMRALSR